jgi:two-component system nitrate/nitrite response regulator NarL
VAEEDPERLDRTRDVKITFVIADDQLLLGEGLRHVLEPQYQVIAVVGNGLAALLAVQEHQPDVVLLDISMPVMDGLEAVQRISETVPAAKVIMLTNHATPAYVEEAFRRGARG